MSILLEKNTRVVVQGITGTQARVDTLVCRDYGTHIVAGVTPGRGGQDVEGIPVYDTVREAVEQHGAEASLVYVPALAAKDAVLEALVAGIHLIVAPAELVPLNDAAKVVDAVRKTDAVMVGFNTVGIITPGEARMGGMGGLDPDEIYAPGTVGICSRSGGMVAEVAWALKKGGLGVSTAVAMGGDAITGRRMVDYVRMFEDDPMTKAIALFGEPGTPNEREVAEHLRANGVKKPVVALIAGTFQENQPVGVSFGHAAAFIAGEGDGPTEKKKMLSQSGVRIAADLKDIPVQIKAALGRG
jgi:succinyl-CoA synthetase alpha subunit